VPRLGLSIVSFVITGALSAPATAAIVINGSFETGDLTGWTVTGNSGPMSVTTMPDFVEDGTHALSYGQVGSLGFLSQTITTIAGDSYTFEFYQETRAGTPNQFQAYWAGNKIVDLVNSPIASSFSHYTFTEVATSTSTVIAFGFRQDPGFSAFDNVSVTDNGPVNGPAATPEPASLVLWSLGALGCALGGFWRRKAA
jgi:hypothetical protein